MTKDVLFTLNGLQLDPTGDGQALETITPAQFYERAGNGYVVYEEMTEGFTECTKNVVKFRESFLEVTKKGLVNVHMVFEENKKNMTSYATPYGSILIGIDTEKITIQKEENRITIDVAYALEANYQHLADCSIHMVIAERRNGIHLA